MPTIPLICEALLDQGRTIGGDPVGHACGRPAERTFTDQHGVPRYLCQACAADYVAHFADPPGRVTLPRAYEDLAVRARKLLVALMAEVAHA